MINYLLFFLTIFSFSTFSEEIKCPTGSVLIELTLSFSNEKMQVCQKEINGKFVKDGPEFIYKKDGSLKSKKYYKLDVLTAEPSSIPMLVKLVPKPLENNYPNMGIVSAGMDHSCALDDSGLKCWGLNGIDHSKVPHLSNPKMVSSGGGNTCAIDDSGVKCWGNNNVGQTNVPPLIYLNLK